MSSEKLVSEIRLFVISSYKFKNTKIQSTLQSNLLPIYCAKNGLKPIFETDHTILNSLIRMRILTTVILLFGNYTKTRIDCYVAFLQL